ncbi:hypothetical protein RhiirB3_460685 [Rhizophagus irregularis]|nr:hypothetical protein RhiirB3_460685 [Rhizophagus irregularis]
MLGRLIAPISHVENLEDDFLMNKIPEILIRKLDKKYKRCDILIDFISRDILNKRMEDIMFLISKLLKWNG